MKYEVHVYATFRVKVEGVEAPDPKAACRLATKRVDFDRYNGPNFEWSDDITDYLVDYENDPEYEQSQFFTPAQIEGGRQP